MEALSKYELAPYLPYELKIKNGENIETLNDIHAIETYVGASWYCRTIEGKFISVKAVVPLLKPLISFLDFQEIVDELTRMECDSILEGLDVLRNVNYKAVTLMIKNHIDVYGLINKGLAIDSTLTEK